MSTGPRPEFWRLLDETRPASESPRVHADALRTRLTAQGIDATLAFDQDMHTAMAALNTWDLWGAAYLALGGCSDDAFEYLRAWAVGNGEVTWALAAHEPEALFLNLLAGLDSPSLGQRLDQGEHLLYAAGRAHEALTGRWIDTAHAPDEGPSGVPWEESDLPLRFPDLHRTVAPLWEAEAAALTGQLAVVQLLADGLDAAATGNHARAEEILRPLFDDRDSWALIATNPDSRVGVAYALGIGDLIAGRVDRAAETFRRVIDDVDQHDELRRGLAQVELARGDLDAAAALLDPTPQAARFDRILSAKLSWRRGDSDDAIRRARDELARPTSKDDHPWDIAGSLLQAGHILVDAGLVDDARRAAKAMKPRLRKAPPDLELVIELRLLEASVERIQGRPDKALSRIAAVRNAEGYSLAAWHREHARTLRDLGRAAESVGEYHTAIDLLTEAGERWESADLQRELGALER